MSEVWRKIQQAQDNIEQEDRLVSSQVEAESRRLSEELELKLAKRKEAQVIEVDTFALVKGIMREVQNNDPQVRAAAESDLATMRPRFTTYSGIEELGGTIELRWGPNVPRGEMQEKTRYNRNAGGNYTYEELVARGHLNGIEIDVGPDYHYLQFSTSLDSSRLLMGYEIETGRVLDNGQEAEVTPLYLSFNNTELLQDQSALYVGIGQVLLTPPRYRSVEFKRYPPNPPYHISRS